LSRLHAGAPISGLGNRFKKNEASAGANASMHSGE